MSRNKNRITRGQAAPGESEELLDQPIVSSAPPEPPLPAGTPPFIQQAVRSSGPGQAVSQNGHHPAAKREGVALARKYTIPKDTLGAEWAVSGRPEKDRQFSMRGVTLAMEQRAAELTGMTPNFQILAHNLQLQTIVKIGGQLTHNNHDMLTAWMNDIGKGGRTCIERAYFKMNSAGEDELKTFLETEEPDFDF